MNQNAHMGICCIKNFLGLHPGFLHKGDNGREVIPQQGRDKKEVKGMNREGTGNRKGGEGMTGACKGEPRREGLREAQCSRITF
jgi:hypothetical protein